MKYRLMAHLVAGFPTMELSLSVARALIKGGAQFLEIQFPFSDPSADGKAIQTACSLSLAQGFTLAEGFDFVARIKKEFPEIPICIMTYANLAFKVGIDLFVKRARSAGCFGLIIPDLPFDSDEGLSESCAKEGLVSIPVAAPSMSQSRLALLASYKPEFIYAALRSGITGSETSIDDTTLAFLTALGGSGSKVLGGFGIRKKEQISSLAPYVHAVVAGSVFVEAVSVLYASVSLRTANKDTKSAIVQVERDIEQLARDLCYP